MTDARPDGFHHDLVAFGFSAVQKDRRGVLQYARRANSYLTEWVHDDGSEALFTWEFALGEYCDAAGWQIGAAETSLHILYPQFDVQLTREIDAVAAEVARLESRLSGLNLADPAL
ncbi:MAG TPA: hypothetical protein VM324_07230 [Egibacteraceae bacterium]|jgi:hypothetical protein|nr:hypothetical protein [Egibacteraceae bacterium]